VADTYATNKGKKVVGYLIQRDLLTKDQYGMMSATSAFGT